MPVAPENKNPQKIQPRKAAAPPGIGRLIRWHLLGLSLLAVLAVAGQVIIQSAPHKQQMEWGLTALTLLALLVQGASVFSPGSIRRALDAQRNMEAHVTDRDAALAEA